MRKLILILLLLPFVSQGQSTLPFSTIGVQNDDTAYTTNIIRAPKYANADTNKVLSVNARGLVEFRTKGVAATPNLDQVLAVSGLAPTRTAQVLNLKLANGSDDASLFATNITADVVLQMPNTDGTLVTQNNISSSDGTITVDISGGGGDVDLTLTESPIKVYYATLSPPVVPAAPVQKVLKNTIGTATWTYQAQGLYSVSFSGVSIHQDSVVISINGNNASLGIIRFVPADVDGGDIWIQTYWVTVTNEIEAVDDWDAPLGIKVEYFGYVP